jgi:hypothetical protein
MGKLFAVPVSLREANDFVESFHRHNGRTSRDGGKFAIGCSNGDGMVGVAIVGRPLSRILDDGFTAEVLRCCTLPDPPMGTCSFLYSACWRAWRAMGGVRIITYTLKSEGGSSLRGAGWEILAESKPHPTGWASSNRIRKWDPIYGQTKIRWGKKQ